MSQKLVLELLNELGGKATTKQLVDLAKQKYPGSCVIELMTDRLQKLHKWELVNFDNKTKMWALTPAASAELASVA